MSRLKKEDKGRPQMAGDEYVSQFYIDPTQLDPDYHYRYVETHCLNEETQSVDQAIRDGYQPVLLSDLPEYARTSELISRVKGRNDADGFVRTGRQILMRCPIAVYKKAKKYERNLHKEQMKGAGEAQLSSAIQAPTFVSENNYSRTQELSKAAAEAFADDEE